MGRRALGKLDPSLDLSGNFRTFEELPSPWDPRALFGRVAPLEIEVGAGKGLFLRTAAAERPEVDFLGIEIRKAHILLEELGMMNSRPILNALMTGKRIWLA